ncbi:hypothetical protein DYB32_009985 [Aphanomyces invadans]|uniref:Peptidase A2 domain-containing protein n=1 Tax=Aphanomyces invadans TaxID=157072 RepID=A0A3R6YRT3_9STRA|nr:hypothetical protein DYB32_009985 [Aphanomyces invadans]
MLDDLIRVLEQDHQEWVLHQEGKRIVEVMARAIRPDTLKSAVQKQLQLQRNSALKSDVFHLVNWLWQFSAGFQLYVGLEEASPAPPKLDTTDKGGRGKGKDGGRQVLADKSSRRSTNRGAMVEGVVRVENILLDTEADVNVVSRGVMDALAACDVAVDIVVHDKPPIVFSYGETAAPLTMSRLAALGKLTLDATCGPLVLRGLKAWVDDTASSIDVIISGPVVEILGFSVDDLLVEARQQKSEWDVSDGVDIPASNMVRVTFLMAEKRDPPDPCLEESDGMHCATPEVVDPKIIGASGESRHKARDSAGRAYGQGG